MIYSMQIWLQILRVPYQDPDPTDVTSISEYLEFFFKHLIINQKEEYTYYLSFYISHFSPIQYYTPESTCLQLEIIFFYLSAFSRSDP